MDFERIIRRLFGLLKDCQQNHSYLDVAMRWAELAHEAVQDAYGDPCNRVGMRWVMLNEAEMAVYEIQRELAEIKRSNA